MAYLTIPNRPRPGKAQRAREKIPFYYYERKGHPGKAENAFAKVYENFRPRSPKLKDAGAADSAAIQVMVPHKRTANCNSYHV
jgi:hypothetical protein